MFPSRPLAIKHHDHWRHCRALAAASHLQETGWLNSSMGQEGLNTGTLCWFEREPSLVDVSGFIQA